MKFNSSLVRIVTPFLVCSILTLPNARNAQAAMVSTDAFLAQHLQTTPRDRIMNLLQKDEVLKKLREFGVDPLEAQMRVASLSDAEIEKLNTKIGQLPAGADTADAILGTALVVFLILLITDILCLTKIFRFTRCAGG